MIVLNLNSFVNSSVNRSNTQKGFNGITSNSTIKDLKLVKFVFLNVICVGWVDVCHSTQ